MKTFFILVLAFTALSSFACDETYVARADKIVKDMKNGFEVGTVSQLEVMKAQLVALETSSCVPAEAMNNFRKNCEKMEDAVDKIYKHLEQLNKFGTVGTSEFIEIIEKKNQIASRCAINPYR